MSPGARSKLKIFNDPVYGFVSISNPLIFDIIEHPYFQRLRRIKQLGLTHLVYPGALHTRFHHSMGAMHLMKLAINELRQKGHHISEPEATGVKLAILLHDIGHGPYSHTLENSIVSGIPHEEISKIFQKKLNDIFDGRLQTAISIFNNAYEKPFLHKLVSSQFDMDRLDYLKRDSFFTGVTEGVINYERLLNMLNLVNDELVIEAKGIYSVEKFITARRLMYWQVYLHKTVLSAEYMLMGLLKRAKQLVLGGEKLFASPALLYFLENDFSGENFEDDQVLQQFALLDDYDIFGALKVWVNHTDMVLSTLSYNLVNRRLFKIELQNTPFEKDYVERMKEKTKRRHKLADNEINYFFIQDSTSNYAYQPGNDNIKILFKDGIIKEISETAEDLNISLLSKPVTKYFICYPKDVASE